MIFPVLFAALLTVATAAPGTRWFEMTAPKTVPRCNKTFEGVQLDLKPYSLTFEYFKDKHRKLYSSEDEHNIRRVIFEQNAKIIEKHNYLYSKGLKSFTLGINEYADMTLQEFNEKMKGFRMELHNRSGANSGCESTFLAPNNVVLPSEVDWRDKGYVTPVKNQGQCGSCWSFSTTGSLEGQHFRKTGKLISLSEQQLVDCSDAYGDQGCNGGLMDNAFKYIHDVGGIESEDEYKYRAKQERTCKFDKSKVVATDAGCVDVESESESALKQAVGSNGPVSIAIDASHSSFQLYHDGVYDEPECSSTQLDHGVLVVGYGTDPTDYWLVKNSWGTEWGQKGYIKMARNKNNQCGVATQASYPLV